MIVDLFLKLVHVVDDGALRLWTAISTTNPINRLDPVLRRLVGRAETVPSPIAHFGVAPKEVGHERGCSGDERRPRQDIKDGAVGCFDTGDRDQGPPLLALEPTIMVACDTTSDIHLRCGRLASRKARVPPGEQADLSCRGVRDFGIEGDRPGAAKVVLVAPQAVLHQFESLTDDRVARKGCREDIEPGTGVTRGLTVQWLCGLPGVWFGLERVEGYRCGLRIGCGLDERLRLLGE